MAFVRLQSARWAIGHATGIAGVILRDTLVLLAIRAILLGFYFWPRLECAVGSTPSGSYRNEALKLD